MLKERADGNGLTDVVVHLPRQIVRLGDNNDVGELNVKRSPEAI